MNLKSVVVLETTTETTAVPAGQQTQSWYRLVHSHLYFVVLRCTFFHGCLVHQLHSYGVFGTLSDSVESLDTLGSCSNE